MKSNGAGAYITAAPAPGSTTTPTNSGTGTGSLVLFESPVDESTVESKSVTASGRVLSANVARVVINNTPATVDPAKQTFSLS